MENTNRWAGADEGRGAARARLDFASDDLRGQGRDIFGPLAKIDGASLRIARRSGLPVNPRSGMVYRNYE